MWFDLWFDHLGKQRHSFVASNQLIDQTPSTDARAGGYQDEGHVVSHSRALWASREHRIADILADLEITAQWSAGRTSEDRETAKHSPNIVTVRGDCSEIFSAGSRAPLYRCI